MIIFSLAGITLLIVTVVRALQAWTADRRMQQFRLAEAAAYLFIPFRWQKRLM